MQENENNIYQEIYNKLELFYKQTNCTKINLKNYYVDRKEPDWFVILNDGTKYILTKDGKLYND